MRQVGFLFVLLIMFFVTFIVTTAVTDTICKVCGYYQVGIQEEQELFK